MGDYYYSQSPASAHDLRVFTAHYRGHALAFETDAGVFSKEHIDKGTSLLLDCLPESFDGRALDLGCGWGAVGVCMAAQWPAAQVVMTDINARAVELAQKNLARNQLRGEALQGEGLSHLDGTFGLIATNPPIRAGKQVVYQLLADSIAHLTADGILLVVIGKKQGADSAEKHLHSIAQNVQTVARGGGFRVFSATRR